MFCVISFLLAFYRNVTNYGINNFRFTLTVLLFVVYLLYTSFRLFPPQTALSQPRTGNGCISIPVLIYTVSLRIYNRT